MLLGGSHLVSRRYAQSLKLWPHHRIVTSAVGCLRLLRGIFGAKERWILGESQLLYFLCEEGLCSFNNLGFRQMLKVLHLLLIVPVVAPRIIVVSSAIIL